MNVAVRRGSGGELIREWRGRRHLSQLELAAEAGISARHLSFVETGRSKPSRVLVLALAEALAVPLRERNALLLAAGYAPAFSEASLEEEGMAPVRSALDSILAAQLPYPALIVDRQWEILAANRAVGLLLEGVSEDLLAPPTNALRLTLHPDGLAPRILNFEQWGAHLLTRLHRQALLSQDPALFELERELTGYPGVSFPSGVAEPSGMLFVPLQLRLPAGAVLSLLSTVSTFGTAVDVTLEELSVESFFPADEPTQDYLQRN